MVDRTTDLGTRSKPGSRYPSHPCEGDPREQDEARVAVGAEEPERRRRVGAFDSADLPGEMGGEGEPAGHRDQAAAGEFDRGKSQRRAHGIEEADPKPGAGAEQARGRADADDGVVARVLQRVDRVVADRP